MLLEISVTSHPLCFSKVELTENEGEAEADAEEEEKQESSLLDKAQGASPAVEMLRHTSARSVCMSLTNRNRL